MPYEWTEPELFMEHRGAQVYHTYKGGPGNEYQQDYWYTTDSACDDVEGEYDDNPIFDVRDLPVPADLPACADDDARHSYIVRAAIDSGDLAFPEGYGPTEPLPEPTPVEKAVAALEDDGVEPETLDEIVHELKANEASAINNGGIPEQVEYILGAGVSLDDLFGMIAGSLKV